MNGMIIIQEIERKQFPAWCTGICALCDTSFTYMVTTLHVGNKQLQEEVEYDFYDEDGDPIEKCPGCGIDLSEEDNWDDLYNLIDEEERFPL